MQRSWNIHLCTTRMLARSSLIEKIKKLRNTNNETQFLMYRIDTLYLGKENSSTTHYMLS